MNDVIVVRTISALLAIAVAILGACGEEQRPPGLVTTRVTQRTNPSATPDCGKINIASDDYGTDIHPTSGPPGTALTLSGTTVRGEDWRWAPSDRLEAWWDTDVPAGDGQLVVVHDMERCRFETTFTVPDAEPGRYKISVFVWEADPSDGYGYFLPHRFTVTHD